MDNQLILKNVEDLVAPVLGNLGYDLIEREFLMDNGRYVLRLYIDKKDGVTIDDCARVSRGIEDLIDIEGVIPVSYTLEVSSPGVNRPIRRREDFDRYVGSPVRLKTLHPVNGRSNYKGLLRRMDGNDIVMLVDGVEHRIPFSELSKARLESDDFSFKKNSIN